jgi:hypothetical protein
MEEETVKEKNVYIDCHVVGKLNKRLNLQCELQMLRNIFTRNSIFSDRNAEENKNVYFYWKHRGSFHFFVPATLNLILIPVT